MIKLEQTEPARLRDVAARLYSGGRRQLSAMFANDERPLGGGMSIYCLFSDTRQGEFILLKTVLDREPWEFPSLVSVIPASAWYEREIHDLFGPEPTGHPDLRPLVLHENWPVGHHPLCKDFKGLSTQEVVGQEYPIPAIEGDGVFEVPVGPIHAGIIEPGHFRFSQAGENVINLEAKLFFTHRGIEKGVEGLPLDTAFYQVERICGACSVSHALSYSQAIESLGSLGISHRAKYIRVLAAELERLYNHVGDIGNICAGMGFAVGISNGARMKEMLMRLNERVAGNRFLRGLVAPGGVNLDITAELARDIGKTLDKLEPDFQELVDILQESAAFLDRVETTGIVSRQAAIDLALVGVGARASGVNIDMRRDHPYGAYPELDFKVPTRSEGDVAARLWLRADEVFQTLGLIRQVLYELPTLTGEIKTAIGVIPAHKMALGWSESARGSNIHWLMTGENNTVYRLFVRSASYSNWPALAVAAPGNIIPDFPLINKSFELCYACIDR